MRRSPLRVPAAARGGSHRRSLPAEIAALPPAPVRVAPGASAGARFAPLRDPEAPRRARVSIPADDQPADDAWHFVLGPAPRINILVLTRTDATARDQLYLREA